MKVYQTSEGIFIKRFGKVYLYVGDAFIEVPVLTAKRFQKLKTKFERESDES